MSWGESSKHFISTTQSGLWNELADKLGEKRDPGEIEEREGGEAFNVQQAIMPSRSTQTFQYSLPLQKVYSEKKGTVRMRAHQTIKPFSNPFKKIPFLPPQTLQVKRHLLSAHPSILLQTSRLLTNQRLLLNHGKFRQHTIAKH